MRGGKLDKKKMETVLREGQNKRNMFVCVLLNVVRKEKKSKKTNKVKPKLRETKRETEEEA